MSSVEWTGSKDREKSRLRERRETIKRRRRRKKNRKREGEERAEDKKEGEKFYRDREGYKVLCFGHRNYWIRSCHGLCFTRTQKGFEDSVLCVFPTQVRPFPLSPFVSLLSCSVLKLCFGCVSEVYIR